MKIMKRSLSLILSAVLLALALLSFASCADEPEAVIMPDINGKPPRMVYEMAMSSIEDAPDYQVTVDLAAAVHVAFITVPLEAGDIYVYSYKGENSHHILTDSGEGILSNEILAGVVGPLADKVDKESWYVDGVLYTVTLDGEKIKETGGKQIKNGSVEEAINSVIESRLDEAKCFAQGTDIYFEVLLEGEDVKIGAFTSETYRVYFDNNDRISRITVLCASDLYSATINMHYSYEVGDIVLPADADQFVGE